MILEEIMGLWVKNYQLENLEVFFFKPLIMNMLLKHLKKKSIKFWKKIYINIIIIFQIKKIRFLLKY